MKENLPLILSGIFLSTTLHSHLNAAEKKAGDHDHHETEQHGSHEHGHARMTAAITETGLEIGLETPAANIFGFEHKAGDDEQHHTVHEAVQRLEAGKTLFKLAEKADCQLDNVDIESTIVAAHKEEKHGDGDEHHDHEKDKHADDDKHDHDEHETDKHADDDTHDHGSESTHSDVDVTWTFKCEQPSLITQIEIGLFKAFPQNFERLDVEWITAEAAGATQLKADGAVKLSQ